MKHLNMLPRIFYRDVCMTCALSRGAHAEADMLHPGRSLCTLGRFGIFLGDDVLGPTASVWSGSLPARFLDFFSSLSI